MSGGRDRQREQEREGKRRGRRSERELRDGERESDFLWVFERERRARSVCVRSVVQLINL